MGVYETAAVNGHRRAAGDVPLRRIEPRNLSSRHRASIDHIVSPPLLASSRARDALARRPRVPSLARNFRDAPAAPRPTPPSSARAPRARAPRRPRRRSPPPSPPPRARLASPSRASPRRHDIHHPSRGAPRPDDVAASTSVLARASPRHRVRRSTPSSSPSRASSFARAREPSRCRVGGDESVERLTARCSCACVFFYRERRARERRARVTIIAPARVRSSTRWRRRRRPWRWRRPCVPRARNRHPLNRNSSP